MVLHGESIGKILDFAADGYWKEKWKNRPMMKAFCRYGIVPAVLAGERLHPGFCSLIAGHLQMPF